MATNGQAKQLFLSYGHDKGNVDRFAKQLKQDLEGRGFTVWMDVDIPAGDKWVSGIGSGIHHCQGLLAVITNKYVNSDYCTGELSFAKSMEKKIFPIKYEANVDFTKPPHAPGVNFIIHGHQWTFFRPGVDDYNESLAKLVHGLEENGIHPGAVESTDFDTPVTIPPRILNIKDLKDVKDALGSFFFDWETLGENLTLHPNLLKMISRNESTAEDRLREVLRNWLIRRYMDEKKLPTWSFLADAVQPIDPDLAEEIRKKHPN